MIKKNFSAFYIWAIAFIAAVFSPNSAQAVPMNVVSNVAKEAGLATYSTWSEALETTLRALLAVSFILAVIFIVISGIRFVTAQGNEEQVTSAKKNLTWSIIGLIVIALAWAVMVLVVRTVKTGSV